MQSNFLLINCPDQRGLIYKITSVLYKHALNIISNGEFVEKTFNHFFMRTEFFQEKFNREILIEDLVNILLKGWNLNLPIKGKKI